MSRAVWVLCVLLLANWLFQWRLTAWKVEEVQRASKQIEGKIDEVASELDKILLQYVEDPSAIERVRKHIADE